jgi:prophage regulatory protein
MLTEDLVRPPTTLATPTGVRIIRHAQTSEKLKLSSATLHDLIARGLFPKPFTLIPGGRAVGWLEQDVDAWILARKQIAQKGEPS